MRLTDRAASRPLPGSQIRTRATWLCAVLLFAVSCTDAAPVRLDGSTMGTHFRIVVLDPPAGLEPKEIEARVHTILDEVIASMSNWDPSSEVSRFNRLQSIQWQPVSRELISVLRSARQIGAATDGAFDITVAPLVDAWGFGPQTIDTFPDPATLERLRAQVGWTKLRVDRHQPRVRKAVATLRLDLSAIAKGYAVDRLAEMLDAVGVRRYLIEIGGELRVRGHGPRAAYWRIAVENPALPPSRGQQPPAQPSGVAADAQPDRYLGSTLGAPAPHTLLALRDIGCATSGDYRNFVHHEGRRISHLVDPRDAQPVAHELASVTVLHPLARAADAYATGLLVLGPEAGYQRAITLGLAALFILRDGAGFRARATPALQAHLP